MTQSQKISTLHWSPCIQRLAAAGSLEILVDNNINSFITVYGAINDGGGNTVTMSTGINSGNVELRATGLAGNTVVKLIGTYVPD